MAKVPHQAYWVLAAFVGVLTMNYIYIYIYMIIYGYIYIYVCIYVCIFSLMIIGVSTIVYKL